jgi:N-acetylglucosaminyldiphosphoundecaprenol N-acetyl-beta-D-mannosaminyltransferase
MEKVPLFGFQFWNATDEEEVADLLTDTRKKDLFKEDNINFLITPNAFDIAQYHTKYSSIHTFFKDAGVVLADGMPIVWLSRLNKRSSLKSRIAGSDLFPILWQKIKQEKKKAFFILPNKTLGEKLVNEHPTTQYIVPGFFKEDGDAYIEQFLADNIQRIKDFEPEYIFIGITLPKQQKIAMRLHHLLSGKTDFNCLIAILGASFEFYFGFKKRAPAFFRKSGTEWLYRFCQEPKRTWRRYTIGNLVFLRIAMQELIKRPGVTALNGSTNGVERTKH